MRQLHSHYQAYLNVGSAEPYSVWHRAQRDMFYGEACPERLWSQAPRVRTYDVVPFTHSEVVAGLVLDTRLEEQFTTWLTSKYRVSL